MKTIYPCPISLSFNTCIVRDAETPPDDCQRILALTLYWGEDNFNELILPLLSRYCPRAEEVKTFFIYDHPKYVALGPDFGDVVVKIDMWRDGNRHLIIGEAEFKKTYLANEFPGLSTRYGGYIITVGYLNGTKKIRRQDLWAVTLKTIIEVKGTDPIPEEIVT